MGVEVLAVVIAQREAAKLYFRSRQITEMLVAVDPDKGTHRAFGVPFVEVLAADASEKTQWPYGATREQLSKIRIDPTGELGKPTSIPEAVDELNR